MSDDSFGAQKSLTRRQLGVTALGAAGMLALGQRSALAAGSGPVDVAIIGAGAAGISAATECIAAGASFVMIEARDRIGGRAHSVSTLGTPVDLGAEWFIHIVPNAAGTGTMNPLFDLAVLYSLSSGAAAKKLDLQPDFYDRALYQNGKRLPLLGQRALEATTLQLQAEDAVNAAGKAAHLGKAPDVSLSKALADAGLANNKLIKWYEAGLITGHGGMPDQMGGEDLYNLAAVGPGPELPSPFNFKTPYGLGNFLANFLGKGIPVKLSTPATKIHWNTAGNVRIDTPSGTIQAKTVVITVPAAVLASPSGPKFFPALPADYRDALKGLPFGHIEKMFVKFDSASVFTDVSRASSQNTFCVKLANSTEFRGSEARWWNSNIGTALIGGDVAKAVAKQGAKALTDYAVETVRQVFGGDPAKHVLGAETSTWSADPYSQGAYSYAPPGNVKFRKALQAPVSGQLFFAGEAVSVDQHSALPGAWKTGERAAKLAVAAARRKPSVSVALR